MPSSGVCQHEVRARYGHPAMDCLRGLDGRLILVVQRSRHIARALASTLVAKGPQVVLAKVARLDLVDLPQLAAAVLNGHSHELCKLPEARKMPFVVYTALDQSEYQFTTRMRVIPKRAPVTEVVAAVEKLLLT